MVLHEPPDRHSDSPKVALYGTGFVGQAATRIIHEKGWEIVAAYNRAGPKIGQDLGLLAGLDQALGVVVQDYEKADYSQLSANIAVIAGPDHLDECFPIYERFLTAGVNVLSFGSHAYQPRLFHQEVAAEIDSLARKHGVTFTGSGLWDMTRIWSGLMAVGPCIEINSIEYATDTEVLRQGVHWAPLMGVGMTVDEFDEKVGRKAGGLNHVVQIPALIVLQHLGYTIANVTMRQEPVLFDEPVYSEHLDQELEAGISVGTRVLADIDTVEGVTAHSRFDFRVLRTGEVEHGTWTVRGLPGMEIRVVRQDSGIANASSLVNRIPDVLSAEPGIVTIMELGPLRPTAVSRT